MVSSNLCSTLVNLAQLRTYYCSGQVHHRVTFMRVLNAPLRVNQMDKVQKYRSSCIYPGDQRRAWAVRKDWGLNLSLLLVAGTDRAYRAKCHSRLHRIFFPVRVAINVRRHRPDRAQVVRSARFLSRSKVIQGHLEDARLSAWPSGHSAMCPFRLS